MYFRSIGSKRFDPIFTSGMIFVSRYREAQNSEHDDEEETAVHSLMSDGPRVWFNWEPNYVDFI